MSKPSLLGAVVKLRCPHCRQGQVFRSFWQMSEQCGICGIKFARESGYFMMSVFFGYVLNAVLFLPVCIGLYIAGALWMAYVWVAVAVVALSPFVFRYSRIVWLHVDEWLDPRGG